MNSTDSITTCEHDSQPSQQTGSSNWSMPVDQLAHERPGGLRELEERTRRRRFAAPSEMPQQPVLIYTDLSRLPDLSCLPASTPESSAYDQDGLVVDRDRRASTSDGSADDEDDGNERCCEVCDRVFRWMPHPDCARDHDAVAPETERSSEVDARRVRSGAPSPSPSFGMERQSSWQYDSGSPVRDSSCLRGGGRQQRPLDPTAPPFLPEEGFGLATRVPPGLRLDWRPRTYHPEHDARFRRANTPHLAASSGDIRLQVGLVQGYEADSTDAGTSRAGPQCSKERTDARPYQPQ